MGCCLPSVARTLKGAGRQSGLRRPNYMRKNIRGLLPQATQNWQSPASGPLHVCSHRMETWVVPLVTHLDSQFPHLFRTFFTCHLLSEVLPAHTALNVTPPLAFSLLLFCVFLFHITRYYLTHYLLLIYYVSWIPPSTGRQVSQGRDFCLLFTAVSPLSGKAPDRKKVLHKS